MTTNSVSTVSSGFRIFGRKKVQIQEILICSLKLKVSADEFRKKVEISRTHKTSTGSYQEEESKMDFQTFDEIEAFCLHDIFLSDVFGLTVKLLDSVSEFQFADRRDGQFAIVNTLVLLSTLEGKEIHPQCFIRGNTLK